VAFFLLEIKFKVHLYADGKIHPKGVIVDIRKNYYFCQEYKNKKVSIQDT
jgi:hypothetical protein